eukprot:5129701-Alexandrium_andersonii.AAC.1
MPPRRCRGQRGAGGPGGLDFLTASFSGPPGSLPCQARGRFQGEILSRACRDVLWGQRRRASHGPFRVARGCPWRPTRGRSGVSPAALSWPWVTSGLLARDRCCPGQKARN